MKKFVLGVVVGAIMIAGIVATCSDRLTVGTAEADRSGWSHTRAIRMAYPDECDVQKTCNRWTYGWHKQHQRVNGEVHTVEVRGWKCIGWEFSKGGIVPACDNEIMMRESSGR